MNEEQEFRTVITIKTCNDRVTTKIEGPEETPVAVLAGKLIELGECLAQQILEVAGDRAADEEFLRTLKMKDLTN